MKIQYVNKSTSSEVHPDDFAMQVTAIGLQFAEDYCPGTDSAVPVILGPGAASDPEAFQVELWDKSDQPGAAGYHWKDQQGKPIGFAFLDGGDWRVTLSHESLELFGDRYCATWAQAGDGKMRAFEMCDAVEEDTYTKSIGGVLVPVSNFLLLPYFSDTRIIGAKSDFLDKLGGLPMPAMTPGGYDIVIDTKGNATQEFARLRGMLAALPQAKAIRKAGSHSRTTRRLHQAANILGVAA